jgi:hypothetical protein
MHMASHPIAIETMEPQPSEVRQVEATLDYLFDDTQPMDVEMTEGQESEVQPVAAKVESPFQMDVQPINVQLTEVKMTASHVPESQSTETKAGPRVKEVQSMNIQVASKSQGKEGRQAEAPKAKATGVEATKGNPLTVKPANIYPKAIKPGGTKPKHVEPAGPKPPNPNKKAKLSLDDMLADSRKWITAPDSYMIRNTYTGCFGFSAKKPDRTRSEITIAHTDKCECMDVRLMHICEHVDRLVKRGGVAKRFRDDLVIVIKTRKRLPQQVPRDVRFPALVGKVIIRRPRDEVEAEDKVRRVIESHNNQLLVEKWKNLKAFKERLIWKDW